MEENKFVEKKWSMEQIVIRLENLKKIIDPFIINMKIHECKALCDSEYDALYMAFYKLKDQYSRLPRIKFGAPKPIAYTPKGWYITSNNDFINVLTGVNTTWTTLDNGLINVITTSEGNPTLTKDYINLYSNYNFSDVEYTWEITSNITTSNCSIDSTTSDVMP